MTAGRLIITRFILAAGFGLLLTSAATSAGSPVATVEVVRGLDHPWSLAFLPGHLDSPGGERLLITERQGRLRLLEDRRLITVSGLPEVAAVGQGGLLDIALSPDFLQDSLVYLTFSEAGRGGYGTSVARGRLSFPDGGPRLSGLEVIYRALPRSEGGRHFGSRLVFDNEGYLYVTLGERGMRERARDSFDPYGSVLRLNPDGSIPRDNPFAAGGSRPGEGAPEIWTTGHRNAQGMAIHPRTGEVWLHEHGPKGGDEVNILEAGADYGWPLVTRGINYDGTVISDLDSAPGYTDAVLYWTPSIAPSGMAFYTGGIYPEWRGNLFAGALVGRHLRRVVLQEGIPAEEEVLLQGVLGRIRDVRESPGGYLYLLTDEDNGKVFRITP